MALRAEEIESLPHQLAVLVRVTRELFTQIYDELWREIQVTDQARAYTGELFLSAVLGEDFKSPADNVTAFARAFAAAEAGGWLRPLVGRCLERSALDAAAIALFQPRTARTREPEKTVLQAALDQLQGWVDPNNLSNGLQRTMPKICLVRANLPDGSRSQGTGFLVGPQTVLTAWHVIARLLDASGQPLPGSERWLSVEFDFIDPLTGGSARQNIKPYEVVPGWLGENSPCYSAEQPSEKGIRHTLKSAGVSQAQLDFAVIRIKGSPGRDRGTIKLPAEPPNLREGAQMKLVVFQHPNQFPQRIASGALTRFFGEGDPAPRFRHKANTTIGSSGGLCVNEWFECVGLHQAAVVNEKDEAIENQAVPGALIASQLASAYYVDDTFDPLFELKDTHEPVLGRDKFQQSVWRTIRGEKRVILVRGERRSGLSFSERILRSLLAARDVLIVKLTADQVGRDAAVFAEKLLKACGGELAAGEQFPQKTDAATAPDAWLRDQLLPDLVKRIGQVALGRQVWLILDDLDLHSIPEGDAYQLLVASMAAVKEAPELRFLLIGLDRLPPAVPAVLGDPDYSGWPTSTDVDLYIQRYCTQNNIPMDAAGRQYWVNAVIKAIQMTPESRKDQWAVAVQFLINYAPSIGERL